MSVRGADRNCALGRKRAGGGVPAVHTQTLPFVTPEVYQVYVDVETALHAAR